MSAKTVSGAGRVLYSVTDDAAGVKLQSFPRAALCLLEAFDAGHRKELRGVRGGVSVAERLSYVVVSLRETSELERSFLCVILITPVLEWCRYGVDQTRL